MSQRSRVSVLAVVGLFLAVWSSWGPDLIADDVHWSVTPLASTTRLIGGLLWCAVLVIAYRRDPDGPMWKPTLVTQLTADYPANVLHLVDWPELYGALQWTPIIAPLFAALALIALWRHRRAASPAARRAQTPVLVAVPFLVAILVPWHVARAIGRDEIRQFLLHRSSPCPR